VELIEVSCPSSSDSSSVIHTTCSTSTIIDLYSVGDKDKAWETLSQKEAPFQQWLLLHGPQGEIVWVKAQFDGGAMVGAMCTLFFEKVQHWLQGQTKPSSWWLRMANGLSFLHKECGRGCWSWGDLGQWENLKFLKVVAAGSSCLESHYCVASKFYTTSAQIQLPSR